MSDITWIRIKTITKIQAGCGIRGICCMGNQQMLAVYEEIASLVSDPNPQRLFRSTDNGQTWNEITAVSALPNVTWFTKPGRLTTLGPGQALAPTLLTSGDMDPGTDPQGVVPVTTKFGTTWQNVSTTLGFADPGRDLAIQTTGSVVLDNGEAWVTGVITDNMDPAVPQYAYIKSTTPTTGPWTFGPAAPTLIGYFVGENAEDGAYLGNNRVVVGLTTGGTPAVGITTDRGATWTRVTLPTTGTPAAASVYSIAALTSTLLIAGGECRNGAGTLLSRAWRSTNGGDSWTEITSAALGSLVATSGAVNHVLALDSLRAVLVMVGNAFSGGHTYWRLTEDGGVTWQTTTMVSAPSINATGVPQQMAVAEDGALLTTIAATTTGNTDGEIWRGVPSGFTVTSPCAAAVSAPTITDLLSATPAIGAALMLIYSTATERWSMATHEAFSLYVEEDTDLLTAGFDDGFVYDLERDDNDAGDAIILAADTKEFSGPSTEMRKLFLWARVDVDSDGDSVRVEMYVDDVLLRTVDLTQENRGQSLLPFPAAALGYAWKLVFRANTDDARPKVYGAAAIWQALQAA